MSQFFELHYHLPEDPARLFDVAQGLAGRMGYRKSWTQFRKDNRPDGTVTFTASGIREWNASDHTERFTWEQWDCCIISQEVIVLTFHQPMLVLLPYTQESESTVVQALNAFGKQDTIYKV